VAISTICHASDKYPFCWNISRMTRFRPVQCARETPTFMGTCTWERKYEQTGDGRCEGKWMTENL
jgi:hypothetical protein